MDTKGELVRHKVTVTDRGLTAVEGVEHVGSFDEEEIVLDTKMGVLILRGEGLHIIQLNLDNGSLIVEGFVKSIDYSDDKSSRSLKGRGKGFIQRILK